MKDAEELAVTVTEEGWEVSRGSEGEGKTRTRKGPFSAFTELTTR